MTRSTEPGPRRSGTRLGVALLVLAVMTALAAAAGAPVRATRGAQVTADEPQYLLSAISLAEDGNLDIADELREQRWRDFHEAQLPQQTRPLPGGRHISPHDPLLPVLLAIPWTLGGWIGTKLALSVLAGVLAAMTAWVAIRRFEVAPAVALPVVGVLCVSAPLAVYGTQLYPELAAALAVVTAVALLRSRLDTPAFVGLGASVVALPWLAVKYAPVAAALAALTVAAAVTAGRRRAAVVFCLVLAAAGVGYAAFHLAVYGGVTPYAAGDHFVGGELTAVGSQPDYLGRTRRLIGLLVDRHFGLAAWQPAWLLLVPAMAFVVRRRPAGWPTLVAPLAAAWLTATFVALTMQGWWFPGRQVIVALPLAAIVISVAAEALRPVRTAAVTLGALGVWTYGWLVWSGLTGRINWVVTFFEVGDPWYRAWSALLPNYLDVSMGTWLRQGLWLAVLAVAAATAVRRPNGGTTAQRSHRGVFRARGAPGSAARRAAAGGRRPAVVVDGPDVGAVVRTTRGTDEAQCHGEDAGDDAPRQTRHHTAP